MNVLSTSAYPPVIGICGDFESGKDEAADLLVKCHGYKRVAFADFLREVVYEYCLSQIYPDDFPAEIVQIIRDHRRDPYAVYRKPTTPAIRRLLQWVGTEYFRALDEDHWVKKMRVYTQPLLAIGERVVIPDMRYPNEARFVEEQDGDTWRMLRDHPDALQNEFRKHLSEHALDGYVVSHEIDNNGPLSDLAGKVDIAIALGQAWRSKRLQAA